MDPIKCNSSQLPEDFNDQDILSTPLIVLITFCASVAIVIIVIGNVMVLLSYR